MTPTEVLAEQHFANFTNWLEPLGVAVELQTGSRKTGEVQSLATPDPLPPPLSPSDGERVLARAGEGAAAGPPSLNGSGVQSQHPASSIPHPASSIQIGRAHV